VVRDEVTVLYAFVRIADTFVDSIPQDEKGFRDFVSRYHIARERGVPSGDSIIDEFLKVSFKYEFPDQWTDAFLHSMALDINKKTYDSLDETLEYIYGSAEVIGLYMSRLMGLNAKYDRAAQMLGRSMQYINFLRDLSEDETLGRRYIPLTDTSLIGLGEHDYRSNPEEFVRFYRAELSRYIGWQKEAEQSFSAIPRRLRIPIKTASDMYLYTANVISKDPSIVFRKKVKPSKTRILLQGFWNVLTVGL